MGVFLNEKALKVPCSWPIHKMIQIKLILCDIVDVFALFEIYGFRILHDFNIFQLISIFILGVFFGRKPCRDIAKSQRYSVKE